MRWPVSEASLKEMLSPSISAQRQTESANRNSQEDDYDPDELCLKVDSKSGLLTRVTSAIRTSFSFLSATQTSPEHQKSVSKSKTQEKEPQDERYENPLSTMDTSFWKVNVERQGEHRPPPPYFFDSPPANLSLRCHVYFPLTGQMFYAQIRPGCTMIPGRRKRMTSSEAELWIRFNLNNQAILQQFSIPCAFREVTGTRNQHEILLTIRRRDFRYWSEGLVNSNEVLICCFSSSFKLVIIGGQQKTEIETLKTWLTNKFLIKRAYQEKVTTGKFQINEAEDVPFLGALYEIVGCTPVKYHLKRSLELEPFMDILFNYRQMIANAGHILLQNQANHTVDSLRSAIEVYQSLISKFELEHSFGWFDHSLKEALAINKYEATQSTSSNGQPPKNDIYVYDSFTSEWVKFTGSDFTTHYDEKCFNIQFQSNCYNIPFEDFRYSRSASFGKRHSFRVQFDWSQAFMHFEFTNTFSFNRLVSDFHYWLGPNFTFVSLDESMLPSQKIFKEVINGKWPVFGTTQEWLHDADTLTMIKRDCARIAKQWVDALAIRLVMEDSHDEYLIAKYQALKAQFIESKEEMVVPKKTFRNLPPQQVSVATIQWRYGRFDLPI